MESLESGNFSSYILIFLPYISAWKALKVAIFPVTYISADAVAASGVVWV